MEKTVPVNGREYRLFRLLGKGKGGYSYLAQSENGPVVVKQIHHEPCSYYQFGDKIAAEINDYQRLCTVGIAMPRMLAVDRQAERIVKEYIEGETVYELVARNALPPVCLEQVREMSALLRCAGLNIDWFPTNFIPRQGRLYYVDYECNGYSEDWNFENWGVRYWSRTPEFLAYEKGRL